MRSDEVRYRIVGANSHQGHNSFWHTRTHIKEDDRVVHFVKILDGSHNVRLAKALRTEDLQINVDDLRHWLNRSLDDRTVLDQKLADRFGAPAMDYPELHAEQCKTKTNNEKVEDAKHVISEIMKPYLEKGKKVPSVKDLTTKTMADLQKLHPSNHATRRVVEYHAELMSRGKRRGRGQRI